jgi:hypothetical protein
VPSDGGVDEIAAQSTQTRKCAILVSTGQTAEADDVGGENRGEFAGFGHGSLGNPVS